MQLGKGVDNYYMHLLVHPSIGKYCFMPLKDLRFGCQDLHLHQGHHTTAYTRALQHLDEKAQPPIPGKPHHLVRSVLDLQQAMLPLVTFAEGDVFITTVPSAWMEITLPQSMTPAPAESPKSCSHSSRACLRGSLFATSSEGWPTATTMWATTEAEVPTVPPQECLPHQSTTDHKSPCPLPGFVEITQTLQGKETGESGPTLVITSIPPEEVIDPYKVMMAAIMVTQLL